MRRILYLSPTSLKLFYDDRDQFYLQYLCETRTARFPQTEPMSVGSAFDAYVKSFMVEKLLGTVPPEFQFETMFNLQVEEHNRTFARAAGLEVFTAYQKQGALADIMYDLEGCIGKPRFETAIEGPVTAASIILGGVPLLGKPDIFFITKKGARAIFDWKVNGYCSNYNMSPKPGYIRIRTTDKNNGAQHPKAMVMDHQGLKISATYPLNTVEKDWAAQLSIYAWLLGEEVGAKFVTAIDQIVCQRDLVGQREFRIAQHRALVSEDFQKEVFKRAHTAWYLIQSGHIFDNMPRKESDARCALLDDMANTPPDDAFNAVIR